MQSNPRPKLMHSYMDQMTRYIQSLASDMPVEEIQQFIKDNTLSKIKRPKASIIKQHPNGDSDEIEVDFLDHINAQSDNIFTPSGSSYIPAHRKESVITQFVSDKLTARAKIKSDMFDLRMAGLDDQANLKNFMQSLVKIIINSLIGGMGSEHNCFYDKAGFNSVTSVSRHCVMTGYAHTERFLVGNLYLPTFEHAVNYLITMLNGCPDGAKMLSILEDFNLYVPTSLDVAEYISESLSKYVNKDYAHKIAQLVNNWEPYERAFVFYAGNLKNLLQCNTQYWKKWIHNLFHNISTEHHSYKPEDLFKIDGDVMIMLASLHSKDLNDMAIYDTPVKNPELAVKLTKIGKHVESELSKINEMFNTFMDHGVDFQDIINHTKMIRNTVIVSDTDSVIFTTQNWVEWYCDELTFDHDAYEISSLVIFWLSKTIAMALKTMSLNVGARGKSAEYLVMKNEFFYPVMMRTPIRKHYAGNIQIQEGRVLPKPKLDIKGGVFVGSKLQKDSLTFIKKTVTDLIDEIINTKQIDIHTFQQKVIDFEQSLITNLQTRQMTALGVESVKAKNDYSDASKTIYPSYVLWQEVFAKKYGDIQVPNKCPCLPVIDDVLKSDHYMSNLKKIDKDVAKRLATYLETHPKQNFTRIPLLPGLEEIPEELVEVIDIRSVVNKNTYPLYLLMQSFGIRVTTPNNKPKMLLSDYYTSTISDITITK